MDRRCSFPLAFIRWRIRRSSYYTINSEVQLVLTAADETFQKAGEGSLSLRLSDALQDFLKFQWETEFNHPHTAETMGLW